MSTEETTTPHITDLRKHLMGTLADLRNRDNPMEPDRARAIAQVAGVLVDTARVEVEYLKATGQEQSKFLETPPDASVAHLGHTPTPQIESGYTQGHVQRTATGLRHTLKG